MRPKPPDSPGSQGLTNVCVVALYSALSVRYTRSVEPSKTKTASADSTIQTEGFDPGSERTLAAWLRHASRTNLMVSGERVSNG